jgi:hypothetical protein
MSHIKQIKPSTIKRALRLHQEWVEYNECNDPEMPEGREIVLTNEIIQKINFINCNLFVNADLQNLNASSLDFSKKKFLKTNFYGANFEGANFENSNFEGILASYADFSNTNFRYANFKNTQFENSSFLYACFTGALFNNAIFENTIFKNASFDSAVFKYSLFIDVDFSNANFEGVLLRHVLTEGIQGFQVVSCQLNSSEPNRIVQYWPAIDVVTSGCFSGTLKELKDEIKRTHKNNPEIRKKYNLVLEYIENMVKLG